MTLDDLDAIMEIEQAVFADMWSRYSYTYEITANRYSIPVVLTLNGGIIGHAVAWKVFEEFHIATLAISPGQQGHGYGELLLSALLEQKGDAAFSLLEVRRSNLKAIQLYEKFGYKIIHTRNSYYRDGEDALVMHKVLT